MCKKLTYVIPYVFVLGLTAGPSLAEVVGVGDVVMCGFMLESATTADGYTVNVEQLRTGTTTGPEGIIPPLYPPECADDFDFADQTSQVYPLTTVLFGGTNWVNANGGNPDFFIFEAADSGGEFKPDVTDFRALLPDGTLGEPLLVETSAWLDTGVIGASGHQAIGGVAFSITDLKDGDGNNLSSSTEIKGLVIGQSHAGIDPVVIAAVVSERMVACNPSPRDGAVHMATSASLSWSPGDHAVLHNVYFGENLDDLNASTPDTFRGNQTDTDFVVGCPDCPYADGLTPGTTYYWRIDEVNDLHAESPWKGKVWSFMIRPNSAYDPTPADDAKFVDLNVTLWFRSGTGAELHHVYFGEDFADVNAGTGDTYKGPVVTASYTPGPLEFDKAYYWRVDAFDGINTYKGEVWSFRTMPSIPILDPDLVGWWKFDEGQGGTAVDRSGHGNHGVLVGDPQWGAGYHLGALHFDGIDDFVKTTSLDIPSDNVTMTAWIKRDGDQVAGACIMSHEGTTGPCGIGIGGRPGETDRLSYHWSYPGIVGRGTSVLVVPDNEWAFAAVVAEPTKTTLYLNKAAMTVAAPPGVSGAHQFTDFLMIGSDPAFGGRLFKGAIDDVRVYKKARTPDEIQQVALRAGPLHAWGPRPAHGSTLDVEYETPLSWSPGLEAAQHDVHFGTDRTAVEDANTFDVAGMYRGRQSAASYAIPEALEWGRTYCWRIDEYNNDASITKGRIWNFTVAEDYLIVDDFESYTDEPGERVFQTWLDGEGFSDPPPGYPGNGTGSTVGNASPPFSERWIVHSGHQSMRFKYDNTGAGGKFHYSEAEREWSVPQDWTRKGVKALTLWFYGRPANEEQLYLAVEDSAGKVKAVNHDDSGAWLIRQWQEWNIDLKELCDADVNLAAVKKMYLGVGNRNAPSPGAKGRFYFDDIRLYRPRCVPSHLRPENDLSGDCVVDCADLEILAGEWLGSDVGRAADLDADDDVDFADYAE
jgi:hypothetical protein